MFHLRAIEKLLEKKIPRAELPEGLTPPDPQKFKSKGGKHRRPFRKGGKPKGQTSESKSKSDKPRERRR